MLPLAFLLAAGARLPLAEALVGLNVAICVIAFGVAAVPGSMASRYHRRARLQLEDDPEQAVRDLTHALQHDPRHRAALVDRARAFHRLGDLTAATSDLRRYLERPAGRPHDEIARARLLLANLEAQFEAPAFVPLHRPALAQSRRA
ncbi:MAG: hypothetical protein FJ029_02360 [Actinobacteria bacterium]|nr:hypothetical protein [Actinomycetota bacterium]